MDPKWDTSSFDSEDLPLAVNVARFETNPAKSSEVIHDLVTALLQGARKAVLCWQLLCSAVLCWKAAWGKRNTFKAITMTFFAIAVVTAFREFLEPYGQTGDCENGRFVACLRWLVSFFRNVGKAQASLA